MFGWSAEAPAAAAADAPSGVDRGSGRRLTRMSSRCPDPGVLKRALQRSLSPSPAAAPAEARRSDGIDGAENEIGMGNGTVPPGTLRRQSTYNKLTHKADHTGKAATLHAEPSGEVVVINRASSSKLGQLVPRVLRMPPSFVLLLGGVLYAAVCLLFGLFFYATGPACFELSVVEFEYVEMLWLSVHTLSSVGFGSAFPVCASSQLLVLLESYMSVLLQAALGAYVVFVVMRTRARVRFSRNCLISGVRRVNTCNRKKRISFDKMPETPPPAGQVPPHLLTAGELAAALANDKDNSGNHSNCHGGEMSDSSTSTSSLELNFRLVRESYTQVRDAHIYVQARFSVPIADGAGEECGAIRRPSFYAMRHNGSAGGEELLEERKAELSLATDQQSSLEHWHVVHTIRASSPLWPIRTSLAKHLKSIDVSLTAYDPSFNQPVKLYARYEQHEILHGCHFQPMDSTTNSTTSRDGSITTVDHSKLDAWNKDEQPPPQRARAGSATGRFLGRVSRRLSGSGASLQACAASFDEAASFSKKDGSLASSFEKKDSSFRQRRASSNNSSSNMSNRSCGSPDQSTRSIVKGAAPSVLRSAMRRKPESMEGTTSADVDLPSPGAFSSGEQPAPPSTNPALTASGSASGSTKEETQLFEDLAA